MCTMREITPYASQNAVVFHVCMQFGCNVYWLHICMMTCDYIHRSSFGLLWPDLPTGSPGPPLPVSRRHSLVCLPYYCQERDLLPVVPTDAASPSGQRTGASGSMNAVYGPAAMQPHSATLAQPSSTSQGCIPRWSGRCQERERTLLSLCHPGIEYLTSRL